MTLKAALQALALLGLALSPLGGRPPPPAGPPPPALPPLPSPPVEIAAQELASAFAAGTAVALDARSAAAYEAGHLPGAVPAWSPEAEGEEVRSLLASRGISGA